MDIQPFDFDGTAVRVVTVDDEPWFVLADLCKVLDLGNPSMVADRVDGDALSTAEVTDTLGRSQTARTVSESGMYEVVFLSRKPSAKTFKRWITHEVLPQIRKTGRYGAPDAAQITRADLARMVLEAEEQLAIAAPKADAFDAFLSTTGDYSVNEAAKVLSRDHEILTGERRLRHWMEDHGWIYRDAKGKPRAYQKHVELGRLSEKAQWHYDLKTGEKVIDTPQVRVTARGVDALAKALVRANHQNELVAIDGGVA